ncbi:MAG: glutathione peroxidase [Pseudomonadota bacterium]
MTFAPSRRVVVAGLAALIAAPALGETAAFRFPSIDGGEYRLGDWFGRPVLVVNTASLCGFTYQYEGLQALQDRYGDQGLVVLAIPSNDFRQELASEEKVKEFCEMTFGLDLPMTEITSVRGPDAHPFYAWLQQIHGFTPRWNFNKVLIGADGQFVEAFGSNVRPNSRKLVRAIEGQLTS